MEIQKGDEIITGFSYSNEEKLEPEQQLPCFITYTNKAVHEILKKGFDKSPCFVGE